MSPPIDSQRIKLHEQNIINMLSEKCISRGVQEKLVCAVCMYRATCVHLTPAFGSATNCF